jgi:hypothetical protein
MISENRHARALASGTQAAGEVVQEARLHGCPPPLPPVAACICAYFLTSRSQDPPGQLSMVQAWLPPTGIKIAVYFWVSGGRKRNTEGGTRCCCDGGDEGLSRASTEGTQMLLRTSDVTVRSSLHGRAQRALHGIDKRELQAAVKHGRKERANPGRNGDTRWRYTYQGVRNCRVHRL